MPAKAEQVDLRVFIFESSKTASRDIYCDKMDLNPHLQNITIFFKRIDKNLFVFLFRHQSLTHDPTATQAKKFKNSLDFCRYLWYGVVLGKAGDTMKILEELWYGRINPSQQTQPDDKSSFKLTEQIVEKMSLLPFFRTKQRKLWSR